MSILQILMQFLNILISIMQILMRILQILTQITADSDADSADSESDSCRCLPIFATYKYDFVFAFILHLLPASFCFYSAASSILLSKNGALRALHA